jgi:biotin-dependent carboxylase-like uncharacterized protein
MKPALRVITSGPATTVQDRGRFGFVDMGVPVCGALDGFAARVANRLVGNRPDCAVLEATLVGPCLEVLRDLDIAVTGARTDLAVNGRRQPGWTTCRVAPGDRIEVGAADNGCRIYIAVTGGIDVPPVMGSRSTYLGGKLGGMKGRVLQEGDLLPCAQGELLARPRALPWHPLYTGETWLRAIPGPQDDFFTSALAVLGASGYSVTAQANRMGYRLEGPALIREPGAAASIVSEAVVPGSIQVPADGQPIILLTEQTLGGYAKIATVISVDLFKVAQARPGDIFHFLPVTLAQAHEALAQWVAYLAWIDALLES